MLPPCVQYDEAAKPELGSTAGGAADDGNYDQPAYADTGVASGGYMDVRCPWSQTFFSFFFFRLHTSLVQPISV
jgi:hypothetical protein